MKAQLTARRMLSQHADTNERMGIWVKAGLKCGSERGGGVEGQGYTRSMHFVQRDLQPA